MNALRSALALTLSILATGCNKDGTWGVYIDPGRSVDMAGNKIGIGDLAPPAPDFGMPGGCPVPIVRRAADNPIGASVRVDAPGQLFTHLVWENPSKDGPCAVFVKSITFVVKGTANLEGMKVFQDSGGGSMSGSGNVSQGTVTIGPGHLAHLGNGMLDMFGHLVLGPTNVPETTFEFDLVSFAYTNLGLQGAEQKIAGAPLIEGGVFTFK